MEACTSRYIKYLDEAKKRYKKVEISFLEYQALGFKAIDDIINDYLKSHKRASKRVLSGVVRSNLLWIWTDQDPLIYELEKAPALRDLHEQKMKWIGKYLVEELLEKSR